MKSGPFGRLNNIEKREAEAQEVGLDRQLLRKALFTRGPGQASAKIP